VSNTERADQRGLRVRKNTFPLSCDSYDFPEQRSRVPFLSSVYRAWVGGDALAVSYSSRNNALLVPPWQFSANIKAQAGRDSIHD
jgi:hypothetical protein